MEDTQKSNYTVRILKQSDWKEFNEYCTLNLSQSFVTEGGLPDIPRELEREEVYLGAYCNRSKELAGHAVLDLESHQVAVGVDYRHEAEEVLRELYPDVIQYFKKNTPATEITTYIKEGSKVRQPALANHFKQAGDYDDILYHDDVTDTDQYVCDLSSIPRSKLMGKTYG